MIETIFYEGTKLMNAQAGTFSSANNEQQVTVSAWKNDGPLSLIRQSNKDAVGNNFMIYQCGMYRRFDDDVSALQLKVGAKIPWIFGYKAYSSLGDYKVDV